MVKGQVFGNEKHIAFVTYSCDKRRTVLQHDQALSACPRTRRFRGRFQRPFPPGLSPKARSSPSTLPEGG
jgi:hypothetical protein